MRTCRFVLVLLLCCVWSCLALNILSPFAFNLLVAPIKLPISINGPLTGLLALQALVVTKIALVIAYKKAEHVVHPPEYYLKNQHKFPNIHVPHKIPPAHGLHLKLRLEIPKIVPPLFEKKPKKPKVVYHHGQSGINSDLLGLTPDAVRAAGDHVGPPPDWESASRKHRPLFQGPGHHKEIHIFHPPLIIPIGPNPPIEIPQAHQQVLHDQRVHGFHVHHPPHIVPIGHVPPPLEIPPGREPYREVPHDHNGIHIHHPLRVLPFPIPPGHRRPPEVFDEHIANSVHAKIPHRDIPPFQENQGGEKLITRDPHQEIAYGTRLKPPLVPHTGKHQQVVQGHVPPPAFFEHQDKAQTAATSGSWWSGLKNLDPLNSILNPFKLKRKNKKKTKVPPYEDHKTFRLPPNMRIPSPIQSLKPENLQPPRPAHTIPSLHGHQQLIPFKPPFLKPHFILKPPYVKPDDPLESTTAALPVPLRPPNFAPHQTLQFIHPVEIPSRPGKLHHPVKLPHHVEHHHSVKLHHHPLEFTQHPVELPHHPVELPKHLEELHEHPGNSPPGPYLLPDKSTFEVIPLPSNQNPVQMRPPDPTLQVIKESHLPANGHLLPQASPPKPSGSPDHHNLSDMKTSSAVNKSVLTTQHPSNGHPQATSNEQKDLNQFEKQNSDRFNGAENVIQKYMGNDTAQINVSANPFNESKPFRRGDQLKYGTTGYALASPIQEGFSNNHRHMFSDPHLRNDTDFGYYYQQNIRDSSTTYDYSGHRLRNSSSNDPYRDYKPPYGTYYNPPTMNYQSQSNYPTYNTNNNPANSQARPTDYNSPSYQPSSSHQSPSYAVQTTEPQKPSDWTFTVNFGGQEPSSTPSRNRPFDFGSLSHFLGIPELTGSFKSRFKREAETQYRDMNQMMEDLLAYIDSVMFRKNSTACLLRLICEVDRRINRISPGGQELTLSFKPSLTKPDPNKDPPQDESGGGFNLPLSEYQTFSSKNVCSKQPVFSIFTSVRCHRLNVFSIVNNMMRIILNT